MDKVQASGNKVKSWAKGAAVAVGGVFAINQVTDWIGAAEEANSISAGLAQSLANAGDATGEWAKHAEDLAGALQTKTGIDDEVIKSGQTILATFHSLTDASGQQANAFDRASTAALDMSKAGFGSVDSASTMLGKALEDPVKGLTALGKAGVTFSDDQKAAIKAMVESGDKAGAMNDILAAVEGQVGGVAEATATTSDKMNVAWGETQDSLGNALLPVMEAVVPALQAMAGFVQENATWLVPMVAGIVALNIAMSLNPVVLIALGIAALIAGLILLWQNWDTVWQAIQDALGVAVEWIGEQFQKVLDFFAGIIDWLTSHWPFILAILTGPFGLATLWILNNWDSVTSFFASIPGYIASALSSLGGIIVAPFQWAWDQIVAIKDKIAGIGSTIVEGIRGAWNGFASSFNNLAIPSFEIGGWDTPFGSLPGWNSPRVDFPDLPILDSGGIVSRPTLAMLAANGRPEAVIPLGSGLGATIVIEVTTTGLGADAPAIQRSVVDALTGYVGRNGPIPGIAV